MTNKRNDPPATSAIETSQSVAGDVRIRRRPSLRSVDVETRRQLYQGSVSALTQRFGDGKPYTKQIHIWDLYDVEACRTVKPLDPVKPVRPTLSASVAGLPARNSSGASVVTTDVNASPNPSAAVSRAKFEAEATAPSSFLDNARTPTKTTFKPKAKPQPSDNVKNPPKAAPRRLAQSSGRDDMPLISLKDRLQVFQKRQSPKSTRQSSVPAAKLPGIPIAQNAVSASLKEANAVDVVDSSTVRNLQSIHEQTKKAPTVQSTENINLKNDVQKVESTLVSSIRARLEGPLTSADVVSPKPLLSTNSSVAAIAKSLDRIRTESTPIPLEVSESRSDSDRKARRDHIVSVTSELRSTDKTESGDAKIVEPAAPKPTENTVDSVRSPANTNAVETDSVDSIVNTTEATDDTHRLPPNLVIEIPADRTVPVVTTNVVIDEAALSTVDAVAAPPVVSTDVPQLADATSPTPVRRTKRALPPLPASVGAAHDESEPPHSGVSNIVGFLENKRKHLLNAAQTEVEEVGHDTSEVKQDNTEVEEVEHDTTEVKQDSTKVEEVEHDSTEAEEAEHDSTEVVQDIPKVEEIGPDTIEVEQDRSKVEEVGHDLTEVENFDDILASMSEASLDTLSRHDVVDGCDNDQGDVFVDADHYLEDLLGDDSEEDVGNNFEDNPNHNNGTYEDEVASQPQQQQQQVHFQSNESFNWNESAVELPYNEAEHALDSNEEFIEVEQNEQEVAVEPIELINYPVIKHGRGGKPKQVHLTVERDTGLVRWGEGKRCLRIEDVKQIRSGKQTRVLQRRHVRDVDPDLCLSLVTMGRTLDIQLKTRYERLLVMSSLMDRIIKYLKQHNVKAAWTRPGDDSQLQS